MRMQIVAGGALLWGTILPPTMLSPPLPDTPQPTTPTQPCSPTLNKHYPHPPTWGAMPPRTRRPSSDLTRESAT